MKISEHLANLGKKQKGDFRRALLEAFPEITEARYYRKVLADRWSPKEAEFIYAYLKENFGLVPQSDKVQTV